MLPSSHSPGADDGTKHFRAHGRRSVQIAVVLRAERGGWERPGRIIDIHLAGAGVETEEPLVAGDRISVAFATPTMWDPLVLGAVVAWAHPPRITSELDPLGRPRALARAGLTFDFPNPDATLALFEMLAAIAFDE